MTKYKRLNNLLIPSTTEMMSLRRKNRLAYTGLVLLTAFSTLVGWEAVKTRTALNKAYQENEDLQESVAHFKSDASDLAFQNIELKRYANDAQMLANSMKLYPDMPDSLTSLDKKDQEKAHKEAEKSIQEKQAEHDKALKTLGVDERLLYIVQQGVQL